LGAIFLIAWFGIWSAGLTLVSLLLNKVNFVPHSDAPSTFLRWSTTLLMFTAGVYLISHFLPPRPREKNELTPRTVFSLLCLSVLSSLLNLYMRQTTENAHVLGTLTGFIVTMLWIYLASLSPIVGTETDTAVNETRGPKNMGTVRRFA